MKILKCHTILDHVPIPDEEKKLSWNFYFQTSLWCLKGFMKALKPFEAPKKSMKIKI